MSRLKRIANLFLIVVLMGAVVLASSDVIGNQPNDEPHKGPVKDVNVDVAAGAKDGVTSLSAECTTQETGCDGVRHGCQSGLSKNKLPSGYVYVVSKFEKWCNSCAGSENDCSHWWEDWVEIIPGSGITQPTSIVVQASARGPRGNCAGRGWSKCGYKAPYTKYK